MKDETVSGYISPTSKLKKWKKEYGYFAVQPDGTIFLSWVHTGCSNMEAFLCASYDGEPVMSFDDVPMFRADWIKENFPQMKTTVAAASRRINIAREQGQGPFEQRIIATQASQ